MCVCVCVCVCQVTVIYIALFIMQIVSKQLYSLKQGNSVVLLWPDETSRLFHVAAKIDCAEDSSGSRVCERERVCVCVCVFVTNEDTNMYNDTGITRRR